MSVGIKREGLRRKGKGEVEAEKKRSGKWVTGKAKELPIANSVAIQA